MQACRLRPVFAASAALIGLVSVTAQGSSHREAPFITELPKVDGTDFYMFRSYEPGRENYITLIANYQPFQDPWGGPNYYFMDPEALYEIQIDNNGNAFEDITFQFRFNNDLGNNGAGLNVPVRLLDIPIPLVNLGPVSKDNTSALNLFESYELSMVSGDRRFGERTVIGTFAKPLDNVGEKTFGPGDGYKNYANTFIHNVTFAACPTGFQDGRVFVGQRREPFAVNVGETFDLVNYIPIDGGLPPEQGGFPGGITQDPKNNVIGDQNITTIALEVRRECLTGGTTDAIGGWQTASLRQVRVLVPNVALLGAPSFERPELAGGAWVQVSRLSMPLVNEVVIGLPDKNRFNSSNPPRDPQFLLYVTNPSLPTILESLFGVTAPTNFGRADLVSTFLTGFLNLNANGSIAEMQRLNVDVPPVPKAAQSPLGVLGSDLAGFPNGRRPGDDVVDIELRVAMGRLCHPLDLDGDGIATDRLALCTPAGAPSGLLAYTDGAPRSAADFDETFPYLVTPLPGSPVEASEGDTP